MQMVHVQFKFHYQKPFLFEWEFGLSVSIQTSDRTGLVICITKKSHYIDKIKSLFGKKEKKIKKKWYCSC